MFIADEEGKKMSTRAKVFKGAAKLLSANVIVYIMQFIYYLTIVRAAGLVDLGQYFANVLILTFITSAITWPSSGFSRYIIGYYQGGKAKEARHLYRIGITFSVLSGILIIGIFFILAQNISLIVFGKQGYANLLRLLSLDMAIISYNSYAEIGLNATLKFGKYGLIQIFWAIGRYFVGIFLFYLGYGVYGIIIGWILGDSINAIFYTYWSKELLIGEKSRSPIKPILAFAAPLALGSIVVLLLQNVDKVFVLSKLGLIELGIYSTLMIASQVPQMLPNSLAGSLGPVMYGLEEKKELNSHTIEKSIRYITTLSVPILLLIGTLGKPLVLLFLGQRFVHDWKAFSILTIGHALMSYDIPLTIALAAKKDSKTLALQSVVSSIILGLGTPFLINLYFATGAAIAYVLARFVGFIGVALPRVKKYGLLKIDLKEYGKIAVSSLLMFALTLFLEIETGFSLIMLPLYIIFGLFLLWLTFKLFNILKGEDLIALIESTPKSINGIIVKLWTFLGFPIQSNIYNVDD